MDRHRIHARDEALLRLRRLTAFTIAAAGALGLAFTGLAARAFAGHPTTHTVVRRHVRHANAKPRQTAPPLVAAEAPAPAPSPQPAPAPTPTSAPPVVVSGGS